MESSELQSVLAEAADEATALGHGYLGPEHVLIAASRRVSPPRAVVLARHGLTPAVLRAEVGAVVGAPAQAPRPAAPPEATTRARRALDRAAERAGASSADAVTPDDLLAGLLAEDVAPRAVIGAVLQRRAVDLSALRRELFGTPELPGAL
jgi:ATP-dependent Clp protease ATP-binding subunit ClpA